MQGPIGDIVTLTRSHPTGSRPTLGRVAGTRGGLAASEEAPEEPLYSSGPEIYRPGPGSILPAGFGGLRGAASETGPDRQTGRAPPIRHTTNLAAGHRQKTAENKNKPQKLRDHAPT